MRRFYFNFFATISLAALLGIPGLAFAEPKNFGKITPQDTWRVGTVDGEGTAAGAPYCAMVDRYEGDIFLAFARDANGYGSLALDFAEDLFKQEMEYEIGLTPGKGQAGNFTGRATTPRSLVVQVGQNKSFYDGLTDSGTLDVSMPVMKISFGLQGFSSSYKDLVDCAASLGQPPVQIAAAEKPKAKEAAVEKQAVEETKVEQKSAETNVELAAPAPVVANPERKLLASTKTMTAPTEEVLSLPPPGVSAQDLEKHQLAAVRERPASVVEKAADKEKKTDKKALSKNATASAPILIGQQPIDKQLAQVAVNTPRAVAAEKKLEEQQKEMAEIQARLAVAEKARIAAETEKARIAAEVDKARISELNKKQDAEAEKEFEEQMKRAEEKRLAEEEKQRLAAAEKAKLEAELIEAERQRIEAEKMAKSAGEAEKIQQSAKKELAPEAEAAVASVAMPAVPSMPVAQEQLAAPVNNNRAAAFLDKIMTYHRKGGVPAAQVKAPSAAAPVVATAPAPVPAAVPAPAVTPPEEEKSFFDFLKSEPIKPKPAAEVAAKPEEKKSEPVAAVESVPVVAPVPMAEPAVAAKVEKQPETAAVSLPPVMDREVKPVILSEAAATPDVPVLPKSALTEDKKPAQPVTPIAPVDLVMPPAFDPASASVPESAPENKLAVETGKSVDRRIPLETAPNLATVTTQKPPVVSEPVISQPVPPLSDAPKPLMVKKEEASKPAPSAPTPAFPATAGQVTLEKLLENAGLGNAQFVVVNSAPGEVVRQWRSRNLNGMYEKTSEGQGNFNVETQGYLDRYREDCPGHLDVTLGETRTGMAGSFAPAVVSCTLPSNSYTTSFVFIQNPNSFGAIAHSGRPGDVTTVKAVGDDIVRALLAAKKFVAPEPLVKGPESEPLAAASATAPAKAAAVEAIPAVQLKPLEPVMPPKKQLRFNIPEAKSAGKSSEFPTVVIE